MSDRFKFTTIAHSRRQFLGPYDGAALSELIPEEPDSLLDVGCGKGASLSALGGKGFGIEINPSFAEEARRKNPLSEIIQEDAKACLQRIPPCSLTICMGASQAIGEPREAAAVLAARLRPGDRLLFGEGFWQRSPDADYLDFLGCAESDISTFEELVMLSDLTLVATRQSTPAEWRSYEDSYYQAVIEWASQNPVDPDREAFQDRIERWRSAFLTWGHDTLGFAMVLWQKD